MAMTDDKDLTVIPAQPGTAQVMTISHFHEDPDFITLEEREKYEVNYQDVIAWRIISKPDYLTGKREVQPITVAGSKHSFKTAEGGRTIDCYMVKAGGWFLHRTSGVRFSHEESAAKALNDLFNDRVDEWLEPIREMTEEERRNNELALNAIKGAAERGEPDHMLNGANPTRVALDDTRELGEDDFGV
jgi:hypothetical protein